MGLIFIGAVSVLGALFFSGIRIVRPTHRMLVETLGKYTSTREQGFSWIFPIIQCGKYVNITEQMVDIEPQIVITKDKLNTEVDAVVYYKVKDVKACQYNVDNHQAQLTSLARTTLRSVIGKMSLTEANENRGKINEDVQSVLDKETDSYGVDVLRVEIQKIEPPKDVQQSMNEVVKAERKKMAAKDFANAAEIEADGKKRASIREAEGIAEGRKKVADANAYKIKQENEAAQKYFKDNAVKLKELEVTKESLQNNSKIVLGENNKSILKLFNLDK